jgi:5-amino-6-(5-phosphoribosylamino)uracil reductase
VQLRRLLPDGAIVTVDEAASGLGFSERAPASRPFVALNMVSSADGKATLAGRTAPMSAEADRELFHNLRTQADGVLVGAGTVRIERYGRLTKSDELRAKREREGVRPDALAVIVSRSLNLPADLPILGDPDSQVVIVTESGAELPECAARVEYVRAPLADALGRLREDHDVRSLLCEGGPTLNSTLFAEGLVDELFLTVAPTVAGAGELLTIVEGPPLHAPAILDLLTAHEAGSHLFLRYRVG